MHKVAALLLQLFGVYYFSHFWFLSHIVSFTVFHDSQIHGLGNQRLNLVTNKVAKRRNVSTLANLSTDFVVFVVPS